jgi:isopenicillin-N epimerase
VTPPIPGARLLFSLDPAVAHLNHGSFGAVPIGVQRAQQRLRDETEANPMGFFTRGLLERIAHTRRHIAAFLGADPARTALVGNATIGIALVLNSLRLVPDDEIVLTDHGYGAVALAVERACRRSGARPRVVPLPLVPTDSEVVAAIRSAVRPGRTRLVILDQVTSPTARLLPVAQVAGELRELGVPLLVDAAHAPGMLPLPVSDIGADFWVGNLHKWAYAPRGTAVIVVAPGWVSHIEPLAVSWEQGSGFPAAVEWQATLDYSAWLAAPVGLFTLRSLGLDLVRAHNEALVGHGQRVVGEALGIPPDRLPAPGAGVSMRVVPLPAGVAATRPAATELRLRIASELRTEVAVHQWQGQGLLRLSAQVYNTMGEFHELAERLPALLRRYGAADPPGAPPLQSNPAGPGP